jgi:uncharacterized protein (TIGR03032 family)
MPDLAISDRTAETPSMEITGSRRFREWMDECDVSIACTTYKSGRLFLFGRNAEKQLSISEWALNRCMGLWSDGNTIWLSTKAQLWRLENAVPPGSQSEGHDRLYVPRLGYVTGDLDIHDVAVAADGRIVFVNTLFSCLATVSDGHSFVPIWKPPFIGRLAAEDRCHLNGLAMKDGRPAFVTAVSQSDVADGWRDGRREGGCVIDVRSGEVVVAGLSMPHSPRMYRDQLWVHDSGSGHFGRVDLDTGTFESIAFCPGYLRGLDFVGKYAIVGLSQARDDVSFRGLALQENLVARNAEPRCGVFVIDLDSGDLVHWLRFEGLVNELYDVVLLRGVKQPASIDFRGQDINSVLSIGPFHQML